MYLDLLLITFTVSFIVDFAQFFNTVSNWLYKMMTGRPNTKGWRIPLLTCSLCVTFWACLIYLIINKQPFVHAFALSSFYSYSVGWITKLIWKLKEWI